MSSRQPLLPRGPDWPPDKAVSALREQLERLRDFKDKRWRDVEQLENLWMQTTRDVIVHGCGENDPIRRFDFVAAYCASWKHSDAEFAKKQRMFEPFLVALITELEYWETERGAYEAGDEFAVYIDLKEKLANSKNEVFVIADYLISQFFERYMPLVPKNVPIRILIGEIRGDIGAAMKAFAERVGFEVRSSKDVGGRTVFIDGWPWFPWVPDGRLAARWPTNMIELGSGLVSGLRTSCEAWWTHAEHVVKG